MTAFAQSEKISLKIFPEPNQTVRMRMAQDTELNSNYESETPSAAPLPGQLKLKIRTVFTMTHKIGVPDKEGNFTAEMTYDEASSETTVNGETMQTDDMMRKFIGKKILTTFNKQGEVIDLKIPPDMGLPEEAFKQLLKSIYGSLPQAPIGVGEIATAPMDFTLPIPAPGAPSAKIDGQVKFKLISVEKDATGRIAKLDQTMDGKVVSDAEISRPNGVVKVNLEFKMSGAGDLVMNVDKGLIKSNILVATFSGKVKTTGESSETKLPTLIMQGTIKLTITGSN